MKRFIKYGVVPVVTFLFLLSATIMVLPIVMNVQKYLPVIEKKLSDATGRSVTVGSNLGLSFFPWLSVSFSDLQVDNPEGFSDDGFIKIESFESRLKLLPLLAGDVEFSRFIVGGLEINLEKREDGAVNWNLAGEKSDVENKTDSLAGMSDWTLPENLSAALLAVTDGTLHWRDDSRQVIGSLDDLMLLVNDFTVDKPVAVEFKASMAGKTLTAEGRMGPFLGKKPGQGVLPLDLAVVFGKKFPGKLKGELTDLFENPGYDFQLQTDVFSGHEFLTYLGLDIPGLASDSKNAAGFNSVSVELSAKGDSDSLTIEKSKIKLGASQMALGLVLKGFENPELVFSIDIDRLNLDQYLLALSEDSAKSTEERGGDGFSSLAALQRMKMTGAIQVQELAVAGGNLRDIDIHMRGQDGVFNVEPATFSLYQGTGEVNWVTDWQNAIPQNSVDLKLQNIRVTPLLHDFVGKDYLSGLASGDAHLVFSGLDGRSVRDSMVADGTLTIKDGGLAGIDLLHAVKNVIQPSPASIGGSTETPSALRTDFSELVSRFAIKSGVLDIRETSLSSADDRVHVSGTADFVKEQLQLEVKPAVATLIAQEQKEVPLDSIDKVVPFELAGSFAKPNIDIAAQYLPLEQLNLSDELDMQILVEEKLPSPVEEDVRDLVGTSLIDPTIVAKRFGLEPDLLQQTQKKKLFKKGSGKVFIAPLTERDVWQK